MLRSASLPGTKTQEIYLVALCMQGHILGINFIKPVSKGSFFWHLIILTNGTSPQ